MDREFIARELVKVAKDLVANETIKLGGIDFKRSTRDPNDWEPVGIYKNDFVLTVNDKRKSLTIEFLYSPAKSKQEYVLDLLDKEYPYLSDMVGDFPKGGWSGALDRLFVKRVIVPIERNAKEHWSGYKFKVNKNILRKF